jgi:tetratricopeptide (TPR) repeat protein
MMDWWIAKVLLLLAAVALYFYHNRLVMSVGSPVTLRMRQRAGAGAAAVICLYLASGAVLKVNYGYAHRGVLPRSDLAWFRYQMASFGPIPVSALFGPAFNAYIGDIGNPWAMTGEDENGLIGPTEAHRRAMHRVLDRYGSSIWAPSIAYGLGQLEINGETKVDNAAAYYRAIIGRFPDSPYNQDLLRNIAQAYIDAKRPADARGVYEEMVRRYPQNRYRSEAYSFLFETERRANHPTEALQWAEKWSEVAPVQERFLALVDVLELRKSSGDLAGAKRAAADTITAVDAFNKAVASGKVELTPSQTITRPQLARKAEQEAKALK